MSQDLTSIMDRASAALLAMDYLSCESSCLAGLTMARASADWDTYARALLPLQESRRQRRMIAAEGRVRLGFTNESPDDASVMDTLKAGCVLLTPPYTPQFARRLHDSARQSRRMVEVLYAHRSADQRSWVLESFAGPRVTCAVPAPPAEWSDRWLIPGQTSATASGKTPADWFLDAAEALGDAAMKSVDAPLGHERRIEQIEACLNVTDTHEILHQRLAQAARAMRVHTERA
jgi:hypothetical protein